MILDPPYGLLPYCRTPLLNSRLPTPGTPLTYPTSTGTGTAFPTPIYLEPYSRTTYLPWFAYDVTFIYGFIHEPTGPLDYEPPPPILLVATGYSPPDYTFATALV